MTTIPVPLTNPTHISVIVPVYNNSKDLPKCLSALMNSSYPGAEIIVVDDGSTDNTLSVASQMGIHVCQLAKNSGPAAARNYGVHHAQGDVCFFVDADVVVAPGVVHRVLKAFEDHPDVAAVFGSYDAQPHAKGVVSQYRNLLHHFVHQKGNEDASTFWAGCGAVRRSVFQEVGGFDEKRFPKPSIEDIELGYRIRKGGYRILLDKHLQGTHLKRWTLRSLILTDIVRRAVPWSRLILQSKKLPNDLNLKKEQRLSVGLIGLTFVFLLLALLRHEFLVLSAGALLGVVVLNRDLYKFFLRQRGLLFATACIPLHLLYFLYSGLSYLWVWAAFQLKSLSTHLSIPSKRYKT